MATETPGGASRKTAEGGLRLSPGLLTFFVGLLVLLFSGVVYQQSLVAGGRIGGTAADGQVAAKTGPEVKYVCPMRCVELDQPGECPVCGMDTFAVELGGGTGTHSGTDARVRLGESADADVRATGGQAIQYICPMHPHIVQDRPGTCPICTMELVPRADESAGIDPRLASAVDAVRLSPSQAVLANLTPVHPERSQMALTVPAIGEVAIPQGQMRELVSWQDGRIDNLLLAETGREVREGQHIADIYSPELVQAQEEYLLALRAVDELGDSGFESIAASTRSLLDASRQRLVREGMTPEQLAELERTRQIQEHVPVYARQSGVVLDKMVSEGMYVMKGEQMFSVADLDPIWVDVQLFEKDAANVKVGDRVKLTSPAHPSRVFSGRVQLIEPMVAEMTRTFRLRVEVANPGMLLRPGMFLDAELAFDYGNLLLLPRNAILHTGDGDLVYVLVGENQWAPRRVTVGRDFGDRVEILGGLSADEAVAGTSVFLLDSEAQLKGIPRPVDGV